MDKGEMTPKVTVLMPVYNVEHYLREAVDSIINQTFQDFELIILDDCSPDHSAEILNTYSDKRIVRYRGVNNVGLANILNVGMDMAKGKYIARMDSDDISLPNRLAVQVDYMDKHPEIDLCSCGMQLFGARNEAWVRDSNSEEVKITALFYSPILHASSVWRRECFDRLHLRFDQTMVPAEDYDMWTRAISSGLRLVNLKDVLYQYRMHDTQATTVDKRSFEKCSEIQHLYLAKSLPGLSQNEVNDFIARVIQNPSFEKKDFSTIKGLCRKVIKENHRTSFFKQHRLKKRLQRYCQNKMFITLKNNGFSLADFQYLRLSQLVHLLLS